MENKTSILKNSMNYGLITGFALVIYTMILYMADAMFSQPLNLISYLILIAGIILGTVNFRNKVENGLISYGRALGSGTLISLFAGIIIAFFIYILYTVIDPDLMEKSFKFMEEKMLQKGKIPEDQIERIMDMAREKSSPIKSALWTIPSYAILGFIFSLITSIFIKKEGDPFNNVKNE